MLSLLDRAERSLLPRLPVFAGGFDLDAAEAVLHRRVEASTSSTCLARWWTRAWCRRAIGASARYRLLETIRQFAADRLAEACDYQAAVVAAAHCRHYLSVAETAAGHLTGPDQGGWLERLDADQANLRHALAYAASRPDQTAQALRFGVALWKHWSSRSRNEEAARLLLRVAARSRRRPRAVRRGAGLHRALTLFTDLPTSLQLAQQADEVASGLGDDRLVVGPVTRSAVLRVSLHRRVGNKRGGQREEAVERARQVGDDFLLAWSLVAYAMTVDRAASGPLYAEAFACAERSGDLGMKLSLHNNAGAVALVMGDTAGARAHFEAAMQAAEAIGVPRTGLLLNLGMVEHAEHDLDGARSTYENVVQTGLRTGDKRNVAGAILGLACLDGELADWHRAAMLHGVAQALLDQTGAPWEPFDARRRQESLDQARQALGDEQLQQACTRGMTLSFDQAIDLALGGSPFST